MEPLKGHGGGKIIGVGEKNFAFSQNFCVSAVKISAVKPALTQAIHFSSLTALRIYHNLRRGGASISHPTHNCCFSLFSRQELCLFRCGTSRSTNRKCFTSSARNEFSCSVRLYTVLVVRALQLHTQI